MDTNQAMGVGNMSNKQKPYDHIFRFAMSIQIVAEQFMQSNLDDDLKNELELSTLKEIKNESINLKMADSISDVVYECKYKDKSIPAAKIIILVEHQSTPDRFMPLRIYHYLFGLLLNEVKARTTNKNAPLPACWAMIFYHGKQHKYPHKLDLASGFDDPKGIMNKFWQNPIQLINVNQIPDEQLLNQKLDGVLGLALKHSRDKDTTNTIKQMINKLDEIDIQDPVELQLANELISHMLRQTNSNNSKEVLDTIEAIHSPLRGELMTIAETLREDGRKEGRIEGQIEGKIEGKKQKQTEVVINCLKEGTHIDFNSKVTGLSKKEINKIAIEHKLH